ncbi:MAG: glycoside hydrolase family 3 N-terminal domain-containing protein [Chloroflexota bacterium]
MDNGRDGLTLEQAIGQRMLVSFVGYEVPEEFAAMLRHRHTGGVTLFRGQNVQSPAQVRALTAALQQSAAEGGQPSILVGADQEGGTLLALSGTTRFPGNMALGATRSPELARRTGVAIGRELAAMGINVNYAPVCDVQMNPKNPVIGPRSFGEDPSLVALLASAMVEGLQEAGVAATAKHFPGHGDTSTDSHYGTPVLHFDTERLHRVELPPFEAAIKAGTKLIMTAHIALPAITNGVEIPATLSPAILQGLLRGEMGFDGVIVSDAMNMGAIKQGQGLVVDTIAAAAAGVDLLMFIDDLERLEMLYDVVLQAAQRGLLAEPGVMESAGRVLALKSWLSEQEQPGLEVVNCAEHNDLAYEIAAQATTLVRNRAGLLPLHVTPNEKVLAIVPQPQDLTPADTSSYDLPPLAEALRRHHPYVDEVVVPLNPNETEIETVRQQARNYNVIVVGTINAADYAGAGKLVKALLETNSNVVAVALRLPYDIAAYPTAPTYVCTYGIQPPSMDALADALWGKIPFVGQLPVTVPDL